MKWERVHLQSFNDMWKVVLKNIKKTIKKTLIFQFVDVHMSSQINFSHEGHSAVIAGKWLKAFVFPTMCDQI